MPLSPSQRVTLIKEISARLTAEDWPLVDATLKAFSLPWSNSWNGTKEAYVIQMIGEGPDDALVGLGQHVGFTLDAAPSLRVDPPFWRKGMLRLFLTHLAIHRNVAAEFQQALADFGISCFVAHNDIEPTLEWQIEIETALATCDALLALLHPDFHASNWTDQEIGFAMGRGVPAFSVAFGAAPYGFIGRFQAFNGANKTAVTLANEVFDAFRKNKQTQRRMGEAVVSLFEQSDSFAEAKTRIRYLEELPVWDASFSTRLRSAVQNNSQISGSYFVPERVAALLDKWAKSGL